VIVTYDEAARYAHDAGFNDQQAATMAAIAGAESDWNTQGRGDQNLSKYGSRGLWQIFTKVWSPRDLGVSNSTQWDPVSLAALDDPETNARAAKAVFVKQGLRAWSTFKNGAYKRFLPGGTKYTTEGGGGIGGSGYGPTVGPQILPDLNPADWLKGATDWLKAGALRAAFFIIGILLILLFLFREAKRA